LARRVALARLAEVSFLVPWEWPTSERSSDPTKRARVGVLMDVSDMDAVMAAMEAREAGEAMA
jgi:hypothetical protein